MTTALCAAIAVPVFIVGLICGRILERKLLYRRMYGDQRRPRRAKK